MLSQVIAFDLIAGGPEEGGSFAVAVDASYSVGVIKISWAKIFVSQCEANSRQERQRWRTEGHLRKGNGGAPDNWRAGPVREIRGLGYVIRLSYGMTVRPRWSHGEGGIQQARWKAGKGRDVEMGSSTGLIHEVGTQWELVGASRGPGSHRKAASALEQQGRQARQFPVQAIPVSGYRITDIYIIILALRYLNYQKYLQHLGKFVYYN
jgi:hypothetical protein